MTTTVTVKARAWGAKVTLATDKEEADTMVAANEERTFHLLDGQSISVTSPSEGPVEEEAGTEQVLSKDDDPSAAELGAAARAAGPEASYEN